MLGGWCTQKDVGPQKPRKGENPGRPRDAVKTSEPTRRAVSNKQKGTRTTKRGHRPNFFKKSTGGHHHRWGDRSDSLGTISHLEFQTGERTSEKTKGTPRITDHYLKRTDK